MQQTSLSAKKRRGKRNDEEGRGRGGDKRGGAERGNEQRSMNSVELTDRNSPKHTRVPSHKHRQPHTGKTGEREREGDKELSGAAWPKGERERKRKERRQKRGMKNGRAERADRDACRE